MSRATLVVIAAFMFIGLSSCSSSRQTAWDPIGVADDSGLGPCEAVDVVERPNGYGLTATVRRTYCSGAKDVIGSYYVFVRRVGGKPSVQTLAFRYTAMSTYGNRPPNVRWIKPSELRISTGPYWIDQVTKKRSLVAGATISYSLGETACPDWDPSTGTWGLCYK